MVLVAALFVICPILGWWIAGEKNRSRVEGCLLGLFLGIFGVLIELLLPTKPGPVIFQQRTQETSNASPGCVSAIGAVALLVISCWIGYVILNALGLW